MRISKRILIIITLVTILGGFLRFNNIVNNPISLNIDEVSYGYSAYSILKTARDENGMFMPLYFQSVGDFKSPVLIYSLVPALYLFGLNEFSVRFTTALAGTLSIPIFFALLRILIKNTTIALIGSLLLTISPWHIFYSRYASESLMSTFFLMLGMYFFLKMFEDAKIWAVGASVSLVLSMYTYHSQKFFIPLFISLIFFINLKKLRAKKSSIMIFILIAFLLVAPLIYSTIFGPANTRPGMVFLSQDIDYTRYVILDHVQRSGENFLLFFFWVKRYLNYFQPDFLFFNGLNMTRPGTLGLGVLYLFELPWLVLGIIKLIKNQFPNRSIIILWILLGIIPASLTNNEQSAVRSLLILPALLTIVAIGAYSFIRLIFSIKVLIAKISLILLYFIFIIVILIQAFLIFVVHFPLQQGEAFMEGTKQTIEYALANKDRYKEIVFDPYRGIEAPYMVNIPHMYILFYSKYDPKVYQTEPKRYGKELFSFNKFTIRKIDWRLDRKNANVLFIGSPWSLPQKDLREEEILKKVYLLNGNLALLIVSPYLLK